MLTNNINFNFTHLKYKPNIWCNIFQNRYFSLCSRSVSIFQKQNIKKGIFLKKQQIFDTQLLIV